MNSKVVAGAIRREIWPLLRANGFTEFTTRMAWRFLPEQIHVAGLYSFNSYSASVLRCTTFSFSIRIGIFVRAIPIDYPFRGREDPTVRPQDYDCHLRRGLVRAVDQGKRGKDIWFVDENGANLPALIEDARSRIEADGLPWFERFRPMDEVLRLLMEDGQAPEVMSGLTLPSR